MTGPSDLDAASQFRDDDPVARLIVHYFYPADLMREHHRRSIQCIDPTRRHVTWRDGDATSYLRLWFASLYVVVKGYRELELRHEAVDTLLSQSDYVDCLREFRNGTFHYKKKPDMLLRFIDHEDGGAMQWADRLHLALGECFGEYRLDMTVRNLLAMPDPEKPTP